MRTAVRTTAVRTTAWLGMIGVICAAMLARPDAVAAQAQPQPQPQPQAQPAAPPLVHGLVIDESSGAPVPRAHVRLLGSERSATTDAAGRFRLEAPRTGTERIEATRLGYAPVVMVVHASPTADAVTVRLVATPLFLPEVLVTAMPSPGSAAELTRAVTQLSGRALERRLTGSVAATLAEEPGISVRWNGPGAAAPMVRGLSGERVVVLQDGQRSADLSGTADDHLLTIDPLTARRIEVVRGPAALLYGSNALGGVVNVLTDEAGAHAVERREHALSLQTESAYPGAAVSARTAQPLGAGWTGALRLSGRTTGDVRVPEAPGALGNTYTRNAGGAVTIGRAGASTNGALTLRALGFRYGLPMPPGEEDDIELRGRTVALSARMEAALPSARLPSLRASLSAHDYAHDEFEAGNVEMAFGLRTALLNVQLRQAPGGRLAEGAWGVSAMGRDYVATGDDQLTAPARAGTFGVFTYQEAPLGGGLALQLGARLDHHVIASRDDARFGPGTTSSFTAASGSAGVSAAWRSGSAALSVARSFRAPTVEELFSNAPHAGTASYEIGDPSLRPETMTGVDAVVRWRGPRVSGELAAYAATVSDFIAFMPRGDTLLDGVRWPILVYSQREASLRGVEGSVDWAPAGDLVVGLRGDVARVRFGDGDPVPFTPSPSLAASLRWEGTRFAIGAGARHSLAQRRTAGGGDVPTAAYTLADADVGFRFGPLAEHSLTLRVANALNSEYRDAASRTKWFAPNPGRNVSLLYRVHF